MSRLASAWLIPICTVVAASSLVQITSSAPSSPSSSRPSLSKAAREAELSELLSSQLPPKSPSLSSLLPSRSLRGDRIVFQNDPRRVQALKPSRQEQQEQQELSSTDSNDGLRQLSRELLEQLRRKKQMLHLSKRKNRIQHPFSAEDGQLSPLQQLYQMSRAIEDQEEEQLLDQLQDEHQLQSQPLQKRSHGEESLLEQLQNNQQQLRKRSQTIDIPSVEEGVPFVEDSNENAPTNKRHLWTETDHRREQERVRRRRKKARAKKQLKDMLGLTTAAERRRRRLDTMTPQEELSLKRQLDTLKQKEQEDATKTLISLNVPFAHTSPEWKLAMLNYFVGMRAHGHQIVPLDLDVDENNNNDDIFGDYGDYFDGGGGGGVGGAVGGVEVKEKKAFSNQEGVVCKVSPYRVCYRLGDDGELKPLGKAQPVNIMRVYRK